MAFWVILLGSVMLAAIAAGVYLVTRVRKFSLVQRLYQRRRSLGILAAVLIVVIPSLVMYLLIGGLNVAVCVGHLAFIWLLCDLTAMIVRRIRRSRGRAVADLQAKRADGQPAPLYKRYPAGAVAVVLAVGYLSVCWFLAHHISATEYSIETDKAVGELRIIQIADAHIGTTFGARGFENAVEKMRAYDPDVVVITGDFVDDGTTERDLKACCRALSSLNPRYGVYFAFGNHDKSYKRSLVTRDGDDEFLAVLEESGIRVLQDETVLLQDEFYLVGRQDMSFSKNGVRASMDELMSELDMSKYSIILDHQPRDYAAQAAVGADLVLSGHTHGGQLVPFAPLVAILGSNDQVYGHEKRSNTDFIVTSGISDWELDFKSGCGSEYVVIDVRGTEGR